MFTPVNNLSKDIASTVQVEQQGRKQGLSTDQEGLPLFRSSQQNSSNEGRGHHYLLPSCMDHMVVQMSFSAPPTLVPIPSQRKEEMTSICPQMAQGSSDTELGLI